MIHYYVRGEISSADLGIGCGHGEQMFIRAQYVYGDDWQLTQGPEQLLTQIATQGSDGAVFNMPLDAVFTTSNLYGAPRLIISVYSANGALTTRTTPLGHGSCLLPLFAGEHTRVCDCYRPLATKTGLKAWLASAFSPLTGDVPDFYDSRFVGQGSSRMVTRTEYTCSVRIKMSVHTSGMAAAGFSVGPAKESASFVTPQSPTGTSTMRETFFQGTATALDKQGLRKSRNAGAGPIMG
jgi:hypothetical protein